jgi:hypothetical protein
MVTISINKVHTPMEVERLVDLVITSSHKQKTPLMWGLIQITQLFIYLITNIHPQKLYFSLVLNF